MIKKFNINNHLLGFCGVKMVAQKMGNQFIGESNCQYLEIITINFNLFSARTKRPFKFDQSVVHSNDYHKCWFKARTPINQSDALKSPD